MSITLVIGYLSRQYSHPSSFVYNYLGDAIWAGMIYFGFRFLFYNRSAAFSMVTALVFTYCIELSQLYSATWINSVRATTIGGLILGYGFRWTDLLMYAIGISIGYTLDFLVFNKDRSRKAIYR